MTAQDKFEKAHNATKTLQEARTLVKEVRDSGIEEHRHTDESLKTIEDAVEFLESWRDKLQDGGASEDDVQKIYETIVDLTVFAQSPNECDVDELADDMKTMCYTMIAHTTLLYVKAEKVDDLKPQDDRSVY